MNALVPLPVVLPVISAALCVLVGRYRSAQRVIAVSTLLAVTVISVVILREVDTNGTLVAHAGGWLAPMGITLVVDRLAAILLVLAALMLTSVLIYAIGEPGAERNHVGFQSAYLVLAAGVSGAFITGDLFNLFVSFEMMLTASYVLLTLGGKREQIRSGMTYIVISLVASSLFVTAIAFIYSATGTVNLADLAVKIPQLPGPTIGAFAVLLLIVFGIKAALFPLFFWLPDSYPIAPSPITAVFAGLLTKVGAYAIIRTQTLFFPEAQRYGTLILVIACFTMVVGVLGAIAQDDVKRILSFNIISHIGFMMMGLGFFTVAGLAGAIFYIIHHIIAKTTLFLVAGLIEHIGGSGRLSQVGGMVRTAPTLAVLFFIPAMSLAGIPPLSGFVAKLSLVEAGMSAQAWLVVAISLIASFLTLFSMTRIWAGVFWHPAERSDDQPSDTRITNGAIGGPALMMLPTMALVACSLAVSLYAAPLYSLAERASIEILNQSAYIQAVLG